jgi:hypothetical protein
MRAYWFKSSRPDQYSKSTWQNQPGAFLFLCALLDAGGSSRPKRDRPDQYSKSTWQNQPGAFLFVQAPHVLHQEGLQPCSKNRGIF